MNTQAQKLRTPVELIKGQATSDGDGVKLLRILGGRDPERFDPFLLLDEFGSDEASDYIGGFPSHPHRGFETITYMLQGKMEHRDHMGNVGLLADGGVQWMTAGKGIIHSEMPKQTKGKMRGFQLWLNLPAAKKLQPARYEDVDPTAIPAFQLPEGRVKAIAGRTVISGTAVEGYFDIPDTEAVYLDIHLNAGKQVQIPVDTGLTALVYAYDNDIAVGQDATPLAAQSLLRLNDNGDILVQNPGEYQARFLVLAGKPLKEQITQHGPFVMNTPAEIEQAIADYRAGVLTD